MISHDLTELNGRETQYGIIRGSVVVEKDGMAPSVYFIIEGDEGDLSRMTIHSVSVFPKTDRP